ncbi:hypothetical protein BGZ95_009063 [Linnemannia exigua]|uniref:Uncharacterized protein n=1 Tax=Linnemannia exigua TaxID=604196 RepID=A0AAD4H6Y3_9FUNG|nr:hypothetical protein BGZ95_009063 [Linnemannia exigua]
MVQVQHLAPSTKTTLPDGNIRVYHKDSAYMVAQYAYALWLLFMVLKALVGFRANLKFNLRWMGIYNLLFGLDTAFEFVHTTLGVIFQDLNSLNDAEIIRHYAISFLIMTIQCYGFFCVWMHKRWVISEMPHLINPEGPPMTFLRLMFPCAYSQSRDSSNNGSNNNRNGAETREILDSGAGIIPDPRALEEGTAGVQPTPTTTTTATTTATTTESR